MSASQDLDIKKTQGKDISFLDDDVWLTKKLENKIAILESIPEAGMVYESTLYWFSGTGARE